ncbi:ZIP family metal transporter [Candidatus Micrarchaeota archaeon]|nr:ZIP family metal transporter [Candidatus Micrarchaeota archaeon]
MDILLGALAVLLATSAGALSVLFLGCMDERRNAAMLAFAAGVMGYSAFEMLTEAHKSAGDAVVLGGLALGILGLATAERLLPHIHMHISGEELKHSKKKALMIGGAIALHNVPEGFAIATAFAASTPLGWFVATTIAIQDIPEGALIAAPLACYGMGKWKAVSYGIASGLAEAAAAVAGFYFLSMFISAVPLALAFSAGAMAYVVLVELLPDALSKGRERAGALAFSAGAAAAFMLASLFVI